jgi:hypothetical protein
MGRVEREVARAIQDEAREQREEIEANERDAARTEQPKDTPR